MRDRSASPFWRLFGISWIVLTLIGAVWSLATPISGAPDEPAHLIKAASVARGQFVGVDVTGGQRVRVPEYIAYSERQSCFAFHPTTTPNCAPSDPVNSSKLVSAATSAGQYNPLYYAMVGWPSLLWHTSAGIYAMRIVSDLLVSLFLAFAFAMVALWRRPTLPLIGLVVGLTPMVFFLGGSVNPNSVEIAATLCAFVGVLSVIREPAPERLALRAAIVGVSAVVAANMRGLSLLWVAVAVVTPFVLAGGPQIRGLLKTKAIRVAIVGTAVGCIGALVWLLGSNSLAIGQSGQSAAVSAPGVGTSHLAGFAFNFLETFYYGQEAVGFFGWLDTPSPLFVYFVWSLFVGGLVVLAFVVLRGRALIFSALLAAALLLLPPILQGIYITTGGILWQGRYILPIFVCAMVGIAACLSDVVPIPAPVRRRLLPLILVLWAAAQFLAFATTLKRYAVGSKLGWPSVLHPLWSPPGGFDLIMVSFAIIIAVAAVGCAFGASLPNRDMETLEQAERAPSVPATSE